jgi:hypothetical protein
MRPCADGVASLQRLIKGMASQNNRAGRREPESGKAQCSARETENERAPFTDRAATTRRTKPTCTITEQKPTIASVMPIERLVREIGEKHHACEPEMTRPMKSHPTVGASAMIE